LRAGDQGGRPVTALAAAFLPLLLLANPPDKVIDVRSRQNAPAATTFEAWWTVYRKADLKGDAEGAQNALKEIRRLRVERNVRGLETIALARVGEGLTALRAGDNARAEAAFRDA